MNNTKFKSKTYQKRPLSIIIGGLDKVGLELADILLKNDGFVIFVDNYSKENLKKLDDFSKDSLISFIDYSALATLDEDLKRLDYVFFLNHTYLKKNLSAKYLSKRKNYLDIVLALSSKYRAKFLLSTSVYSQGESDEDGNKDIEFKVYAEKLTKEYINKVKLNGRIVVLGEIIGDGIDFDSESVISKLVLNAAKGEPLEIPQKGMQKQWFVHNMDAAFALFKAQFSRISNQKTYLAAYEYPYTYISIAYKVQEIESNAKDIEFSKSVSELNLENIKLPDSLSEIGWSPKISLEKALKQSISSAKIYLLENVEDEQKRGLMKRFRSFFEITSDNSKSLDESESGPVGRLILERKRQEEQARRLLSDNSKLMEDHKMKRPSQLTEVIEESSEGFFGKVKQLWRSLRSQKRSRVIKYFFVISIFLIIYLFVISPIVVLLRNSVVIGVSYNNLQNELTAKNYSAMAKSAENISYSLGDINSLIARYVFLFDLLNQEGFVNSLTENILAYKLYAEGISDVSNSLTPLFEYFSKVQSNISQRSEADGFLAVDENTKNYEESILAISNRIPVLKVGVDKIESSISKFSQIDYSVYPSQLSDMILTLNQDLRTQKSNFDQIESIEYLPEILGVYGEKNYAFLLFDNTDLTPIGGELKSIIYAQVLNGSIKSIKVVKATDSLDWKTENQSILGRVNERRTQPLTSIDESSDYESISDYSQYVDSLSGFFTKNFGASMDGVIAINYSALESFIYKFSSENNFEADGVNFSKESLLGYFERISQNEDFESMSASVSTDLFSQLFYYLTSSLGQNYIDVFSQAYEEIYDQNIYLYFPEMGYSSYVEKNNLDFSNINYADIYIKPAIQLSSSNNSYLNVDLSSNLLITKDGILSFKNKFTLPKESNNSLLTICLPVFVSAKDIQVKNIPEIRVKVATTGGSQCVLVNIESESEVELGWNVRSFSITEKPLSLVIVTGKIKGTSTKLDFGLTTESGINLISSSPELEGNSLLIGNLSSDQGIRLTISK